MTSWLPVMRALGTLLIILGSLYRGLILLKARISVGKSGWRPLDAIWIGLLLMLITKTWIVEAHWVTSRSMQPTLEPRDVFLALKRPFWAKPVVVGDIVVLRPPSGVGPLLVKRVAGAAGDQLIVGQNFVLLNGLPLEWHQNAPAAGTDQHTVDIPEGKAFVLGDNMLNSVDSRTFGLVSLEQIQELAVFRVYPSSRWGWLLDGRNNRASRDRST